MGSITRYLSESKEGDRAAIAELVARTLPIVVEKCRANLSRLPTNVGFTEPDDVAQVVVIGFLRNLENRRVSCVNREELFQLLAVICRRKSIDAAYRKRGPIALSQLGEAGEEAELQLADNWPRPDQEVVLNENYRRYIEALPDNHRRVAELFLCGLNQPQIGDTLAVPLRTVERRMKDIRETWKRLATEDLEREE